MGLMMRCEHRSSRKVWAKMQNGVMKPHPYCARCGTLKNVSSDKGKSINYFIVALSRLRKILERRGYKISDAQIRLIVKDLKNTDGFTDTWWMTFSRQKEIFTCVVWKYVKISKDLIDFALS